MGNIDRQTADKLFEISKRFACEDTPEVKQMILDINAQVPEEAKRLHRDSIIIDQCNFSFESYSWNLAESGITALAITSMDTKADAGVAIRYLADDISTIHHNADHMLLVEKPDDILRAKAENKVGIILGSQNCEFLHHNDLDATVYLFHKLGMRIIMPAYNHRSFAADGCYQSANAGLSNDGKKLIAALQKYGVTVDLSHVGERSTLDALDMAQKPMIFSHSNPKKYVDHPRNITDEQAKKCAATGGVVGATAFNVTLFDGVHFPTIDNFIDCIDYYVQLIGIDHVGIGIDSNITIGGYEHRKQYYFSRLTLDTMGTDSLPYKSYLAGRGVLSECSEGLMNLANYPNITYGLMKRGYKEQDIKKILGENWLRVYRETWV